MPAPLSDSFPYISMSVFPQTVARADCPPHSPARSLTYVHKPKDTDKHEHFIEHLVYIVVRDSVGENVPADEGGDSARVRTSRGK
ncbi:hypothetical protein BHM03_00025893 [Ensete ventricosum]|nr:hypothetical protein BHM03_00025893 [Ensete ventricosum]